MTTTSFDSGITQTTDALRLLVDDVLRSLASDDAERYSADTREGRALLSLAVVARRAAAALAAEPGAPLADAPGTVVRRELAGAARLLGEAAETAHRESWQIADLLVRAERLQAQLGGR